MTIPQHPFRSHW
jgi:hypothetical protein